MIRIEIDIEQDGDNLNIVTRQLIQKIPTQVEFMAEKEIYTLVMDTIKKAKEKVEQKQKETIEKDEENDKEE